MNARGPWAVTCRDAAGRPRCLTVLVRGSEVVVVAPAGEAAALNAAEAEQFRSVFTQAKEVAATRAPGGSGTSEKTGAVSTVKQYGDGDPRAVAGPPASPSCRGGTTTPASGSAAIPALQGGLA
ncbi:hypothetical protein SAMN05192558_10468 [Actinokineospora alba]|uniref:Uncharacterized protein n=1 Tax=Actinokineospora alba TaxID=504798 RepID=A0A1H0LAT5_9PSEU|nr:hypothetical protein C8E96_2787 [Actinokineospora alba]SDJ02807.1 hypothetical protein SAMN05421871_109229 [Actinokineospora alba]SDO65091.1 hypothetical protein SAMN05192558_10468 [Actinokineospora alba]